MAPLGTTEHARYFVARDGDGVIDGGDRQGQPPPSQPHFAAAYLDLSKGPETEMYLYTTLEDAKDLAAVPDDEVERVLDLAVALLQRGKIAAQEVMRSGAFKLARGAGFLVGGLHQPTYELLCSRRGLTSSYWNPHHAWLFRLERLPALPGGSEDGPVPELRWDVVRRDDVPLIASRTYIPKIEATLMSEPSVGVRDATGTLVAWGFIGVAGTLSTLHVEEPYRGKGMAKAVATKVLQEHSFGNDGWGSADVHIDNAQSQGDRY
ncbi:putative gcn5-related n-acetyltransferase [Diaporthe ampelina]|uniref:Putative gcn5-related n-acetyltransferase n=1 Tax=Diaporthe ampelina TaxID=1214573 RepID=A0A0G2I3I8_9PEZI|nr:putative gcn5-related n-acetyltransferase [Diaporthe ampelina]